MPQDVEWAFDGRRTWVVQARPITGLPRPGIPLARALPTVWTNGNLSDAIAGVPTTATWSFIAPYLNGIFYAPFSRIGYPVPAGLDAVRRFDGRAYLDLTLLQAIYFDALGASAADTNKGLGGPPAELPLPEPDARWRRRWRRYGVRMLGLLIREARSYPAAIARIRAAARHYAALDYAAFADG